MKTSIKYKLIALIAVCSMTMLSACLEDTGYLNIFNAENSGPIVSFAQDFYWQPGQTNDAKSFEVLTTEQDLEIIINVARGNADVIVTVALDPESLDAYNIERTAAGESTFELLSETAYTIPSLTVTVPKGTMDKSFVVKINTSLMDLSKKSMLPFKIVSATNATVASNLNTALYAVVVKNPYEGDYKSTGIRYNFAATGDYTGWDNVNNVATGAIVSTGPWTFDPYYVNTVDATTSRVHAANADGGFGEIFIRVNVDNTVTVLPGTTVLNALIPLPGKTSTYDPATKIFNLWYQYTNTTGSFRTLYHKLELK